MTTGFHSILTHETSRGGILFEDFTAHMLRKNGRPPPPSTLSTKRRVYAYINHGRWIAECPDNDCNGAVIPSDTFRYFICPYCGNRKNDGHWFNVMFPRDRVAIERQLLRRAALRPNEAYNRNWVRGETLTAIRQENRDHGLDDT